MASKAAKANASLDLEGKTAAVSGGTTGIGASVALRFAQLGCSRVLILGRNDERGLQVVQKLKDAAAAKSRPFDADFVKADLSTAAGIRDAADRLAKRSENGIDYLIMTSGGPPDGLFKPNADGQDSAFMTQCVGRFGLSYLLASRGAIKDGGAAVSVASPGVKTKELDLNDLDLRKRHDAGRNRLLYLVDQGSRDSTVVDGFTEELNARYPKVRFYHIFPGLVATDSYVNPSHPWLVQTLGRLSRPLIPWVPFLGNSAESYSEVPVYLAANPKAGEEYGTETRFNQLLWPVKLGPWAGEADNRKKLFAALQGLLSS